MHFNQSYRKNPFDYTELSSSLLGLFLDLTPSSTGSDLGLEDERWTLTSRHSNEDVGREESGVFVRVDELLGPSPGQPNP